MPNRFGAESPFRAFSAWVLIRVPTQGVALGYHISRPWRWGLDFDIDNSLLGSQTWIARFHLFATKRRLPVFYK
jgi:hypothetical protein